MRINFGCKPWLLPQPVLLIATYDAAGNPDIMNAAWGGMYEGNLVELCLSEGHKSTKNILSTKAFTLGFADEKHVIPADFVGLVSANNVPDKVVRSGFKLERSAQVNAPVLVDLPITMECVLDHITENGNIIGKIVNVSAREDVVKEDGTIDADKLHLITFCPVDNTYRVVEKEAGKAFSCGLILK